MDGKARSELSIRGNGRILILLAAMAMMVMFIEIMLVPALPIIAQEYPQDSDWVSWVLSVYLLVGAVATPIAGKLGDLYGKKKMMVVTMAVYTAGLVGCGFSWSMPSLIFFRGIQGIGMGMFPLAFGIVRDTFPKRAVPVAVGIISAMFSIGVSVGLVGGGFMVSRLSWRDCFYLIAPLFVFFTVMTYRLIEESPIRYEGKVDLPGAAMLGGGVFTFLFGLTQGEAWHWDSRVITVFLISGAVILLFIIWERRTPSPIISLDLMANKEILCSNTVAIFIGLSMFLMFQTLPFLLMSPVEVGGLGVDDAFMVGVYMSPSAVAQLFMGPMAGVFSRKRGARWVLSIGTTIFLVGFIMLILFHSSVVEIMLDVFIAGSGLGLAMVGLINLIVQGSPQEQFGIASGMNSLFRVIGGSVGPVLAAVIMAQFTVSWIPPGMSSIVVELTSESGYVWAWTAGAIFAFIGLVFSIALKSDKGGLSGDSVHEEKKI